MQRLLPVFTVLLFLCACGPDLPDPVTEAYTTLPGHIGFNEHVRPILSDRCYACHGPDAAKRQAGLRLDTPEGAYAALSGHPGLQAVLPGDPQRSEAIVRMLSDDPELIMPPPESNLSLAPEEMATLYKWIEQGAEYQEHWAFLPPQEISAPGSIDTFVRERLDQEKLKPAYEADKATLLRRVNL